MAAINQAKQQGASIAKKESFPPSSNFIALLEYEAAAMLLTTHMVNGAIYQHFFVLPPEWDELKHSQSHGKLWNRLIKGKKILAVIVKRKSPKSLLSHPARP